MWNNKGSFTDYLNDVRNGMHQTNIELSFEHKNVSPELYNSIHDAIARNETFALKSISGKIMFFAPAPLAVMHPSGTVQLSQTKEQFFNTISMALYRYKTFIARTNLIDRIEIKQLEFTT
jgi:hypothetical protein